MLILKIRLKNIITLLIINIGLKIIYKIRFSILNNIDINIINNSFAITELYNFKLTFAKIFGNFIY